LSKLAREKQQTSLQNQLGSLSQIKSSIGPKLAGLGIGALGGIFGGALLGVGFAAAQAAISAIGEKLLDIVDPARHARDAVKELGTEVNKLASSENISQLDAAKAYRLGLSVSTRIKLELGSA
jgi:phage-related protein